MYKIEFDEENHIYKVDGEVKQSVTQILKSAGVVADYSDISPYYAERGTAVHEYCTLYAQGFLDWDAIREDCLEFVRTFESIVFRLGLEYISSEEVLYDAPLYCPECDKYLEEDDLNDDGDCKYCGGEVARGYDYCGKYDLIMMWNGKRTLVELKTGVAPMWLGLQLAAYERMVDVDDVLGIELKTGKVYVKADDYHLNHEVWRDINTGFFLLGDWTADRKRRRMKVMK